MGKNRTWRGKPKLGQHFLAESGYCAWIVEAANISSTDHVVEIGPGKGALTGLLAQSTGSLTLVEPDEALARSLARIFPSATLIGSKAEEVDYSSLAGPLVVVSNLPYYASVHIFKHLTEHKRNIARMVLMFQKEVAERIAANAGEHHYGSLSVWSGYHWRIEMALEVPPEAFRPPPKVRSAVLRFTPRATAPVAGDEEELFRLVRASFAHKRRTLWNNLKGLYTPESISAASAAAALDLKIRAEEVSLQQFALMLPALNVVSQFER